MDSLFLKLLIFGLLAAIANILGGLILFPSKLHERGKRLLRYLLAVGAGYMLSVTMFEIIPESIILWQGSARLDVETLYFPMMLIIGGYLLTQFFEHTIAPHFHLGEEMDAHDMISTRSAYTAIGGLVIHTFFDGVSIAAASQIDVGIGFLVFVAVFLHKFPEGFTVGSMVMAAGGNNRAVMIATSTIGVTTLVGVIFFYLIGTTLGFTVAYALPISAGVTLYVAASDLIPEVNHHGGKSPLVSLLVFGGVALFFVTQTLMESFLHPH